MILVLGASPAATSAPALRLEHLRGNLYLAEDFFYVKENSLVYVGDESVTVIGATWTPETARLLAGEIRKVTPKPIREVIDTDSHLDRAGGNAYFKSIGAVVVSTRMTSELLTRHWDEMVEAVRKDFADYPDLPPALPDQVHPGDFQLQAGRVRAFYLGPSHTPDGIFVYFPEEKVLYGNCILKEHLGNLASANLSEYPSTLRKLKQLDLGFTTVIAGHWSAVHGPDLVDHYLRLLEGERK
jgi:metallo-beta-lactamase class B